MARLAWMIGAVFGLALLSGCSAYVGDFQYVPHPALEEIPPNPPDKNPPVSAFASVIGVRRADSHEDIPQAVEVRFRLENNGPHSVSFDPQSLQLMTGDLLGFEPPIVRSPQAATLASGDIAMFDVFFPFPRGYSCDNTDMRSLQLRWSEKIDASPVTQVTSFRRIYPYRNYYYGPDPYWGYPWFYGGVVVRDHRRW
jgi:hypothetical protein